MGFLSFKKKSKADPFVTPRTADWNTKFDSVLGSVPVRLHYWPAYRNPYQALLYGSDTPRFFSKANPIEAALEDLEERGDSTKVCFHLHWLNFLFSDPDENAIRDFLERLRRFCQLGGEFLWTVHNLQEHDLEEGPRERAVRQEVIRLAKTIFTHGSEASAELIASLPEAASKIHEIRHGSYIGVYPDEIAPHAAREMLALSPEETVFLSLGMVRRYKGLPDLCDAVEGLVGARLVIAGKIWKREENDFDRTFAGYRSTRFFDGWVADADIQTYMNAADFVVLPYQRSLTSGAALLALSFGVPVIAPDYGPFPEVIGYDERGILYDRSSPGTLVQALERAHSISAEQHAVMRLESFRKANTLNWSDARFAIFRSLMR